jgi:hypothetical protein
MDQPSTAKWKAFIAPALAVVIIVAGLFIIPTLTGPNTETPPAAVPAPVATQPVEQPADPAPTDAPEPTPTEAATSSVPEPKFTRDDLNILGQSIWDAFGEDVVLSNSGVQYSDANYNTKVVRPFDPTAELGDEKPLNIQGSNWVLRVTESDPKNGTVWSVIT